MNEETPNWKLSSIIKQGWRNQADSALRINEKGMFYNIEGLEIKAPLDIEAAFRKALNIEFALSEQQQVIFDYLVENEYNMDDVFTAVGEIGNDYYNCEGYTPIPAIVVAYGELEGDRIAQVICRFLDYQAKKDK
ncbi:hypothetical protein [Listeria rustica]|uniref:Uncharacterized protein n=1 Tax=Listeria rustica TaxID=2713503 RepID=A0A7W1T6T2_9LIST|nr:hypothetical protein [Listeria rustica]MBA3926557.1 hypothetical protein [Listeria rustica]